MNGYSNRNYGGQRGGGQRGYNNQRQGGNVRGAFKPNSGKLNHNERMRPGRSDPQLSGVCNIEMPNGQTETFYVSGWVNDDGTIGLGFRNVNEAQGQGYNQNRSYAQNQPSQGGFRQGNNQGQGYYRGGGNNYENRPRRDDFQQERFDSRQQGNAMSRARDISPPHYQDRGAGQQYRDEPPPHDSYPETADGYNENEQPFDDAIPF